MLRITLLKLWHKKWMMLCLLLGSMLLIATVVSFPLYKKAAFDDMLRAEFENYLVDEGEWPAMNVLSVTAKKDSNEIVLSEAEAFVNGLDAELGVTGRKLIFYYALPNAEISSLMKRDDLKTLSLRLGFLTELDTHCELVGGEMYSEDGLADDGSIEVVISEEGLVNANLLVGETLQFDDLKDGQGNAVRIKITGVYKREDIADFYWQVSATRLENVCLMQEDLFRELFLGANNNTITAYWYELFAYEDLEASRVQQILDTTAFLTEESEYQDWFETPVYVEIMEGFQEKEARIEATLFIMQVPVLILLCAFLFMISSQMYDMERNEISVMKSRGSFGRQIFVLYLYQSIFITAAGTVSGIPLGVFFCKLLGSTRNFLEFNLHRNLRITFDGETLAFALCAIAGSILVMTLPAWKHSQVSIVNLKQKKASGKLSWWEKCGLDIICIGVSLYGYYTFSANRDQMAAKVLMKESLDPLLYVSSSLFIVGLGLLTLRLQPLLVKGLFRLGKKRWKPSEYTFFLENIKNGRKQQFIMLFMILTVSLGMYHATVARTIMQNSLDNAEYMYGADLMVKEVWKDNSAYLEMNPDLEYGWFEPDYSKYAALDCAASYTRVMRNEQSYIWLGGRERLQITIMGIHTKEFGENTQVDTELLEKPYYTYLNELAVEKDGLLVSSNFRNVRGYRIGDMITCYDSAGNKLEGHIVDFVDYWPGYEPYKTVTNEDGSVESENNYLVITHFDALMQKWGVVPYEVWITMEEDYDKDILYQWIEDNDVSFSMYTDKEANLEKTVEDPLLQGTNGVLTMGFIVTLLLCAVGYLIYWIMSIKAREMLFGILRACGMHKGEVFRILINEQVFSGGYAIVAGIAIGKLTSRMFVPVLQTAYAAANQALPMYLITDNADMVRLYGVIGAVMLLCLAVLFLLVFKLNITKALKLGEE